MSEDLAKKECRPCQGNMPKLPREDAQQLLAALGAEWRVVDNHHLEKTFRFKDFKDAIAWVDRLADVAEKEDHHPNIHIDYDKVRLDIWTHKIGGLSENDFILAAKADLIGH